MKTIEIIASNTFDNMCKAKTKTALENGLTVQFIATCIGHTRAEIFESAGINYIKSLYGENRIQEIEKDGEYYYKLKKGV